MTHQAPVRPLHASVLVGAVVAAVTLVPGAAIAHQPVPVRTVSRVVTRTRRTGAGEDPEAVARAAFRRMSRRQRVGQLFMLGVPSVGLQRSDIAFLRRHDAGNVYLSSTTSAGVSGVARATTRLTNQLAQAGVQPFIGTDQEGGEVQRLNGPGFDAMPTALDQGRLRTKTLRARTQTWGQELVQAGLNMDLAPVADTVPKSIGTNNAPIGQYYREYGYTPQRVGGHVTAAVDGFQSAGIATTIKHFPGLGRATGNTDTDPHASDPVGPHSPSLQPYADGVDAGTQFVMVSSARYPNIDGRRGCFSPVVIGTMLRGRDGFGGIVVSDSFDSAAISTVPVAKRAVRFVRAGGTMVLDSEASQLAPMETSIVQQMHDDPAFTSTVKQDVMDVLVTKARDQLIGT